jgi:hypothetical protein
MVSLPNALLGWTAGFAQFKSLAWVGSPKRGLLALPEEVIDTFGYALHAAQAGRKHDKAKPQTALDPQAPLKSSKTGEETRTARSMPCASVPRCFRAPPDGLSHQAWTRRADRRQGDAKVAERRSAVDRLRLTNTQPISNAVMRVSAVELAACGPERRVAEIR